MARRTVLVLTWQRSATSAGARRGSIMFLMPLNAARRPAESAIEAEDDRAVTRSRIDRHQLRRGPLNREVEDLSGITYRVGGRELDPVPERWCRGVQVVREPAAAHRHVEPLPPGLLGRERERPVDGESLRRV